jgi:hypothetical protein
MQILCEATIFFAQHSKFIYDFTTGTGYARIFFAPLRATELAAIHSGWFDEGVQRLACRRAQSRSKTYSYHWVLERVELQ